MDNENLIFHVIFKNTCSPSASGIGAKENMFWLRHFVDVWPENSRECDPCINLSLS